MTFCASRFIPAGLLVALAVPAALSQAVPSPLQEALKAVPDSVQAPVAEPAAPKPPRVVCSGDQLTISANNSSLESILIAVRGCSGAKIDIPETAGRTRSYEELGPGPVRKVLDALLSGTEFNYVIQSSDAFPQRVESVTLTARKSDSPIGIGGSTLDAPSSEIAMTPARKKWLQMQKFDKPDPNNPEQDPRLISDGSVTSSDAQTATDAAKAQDTPVAETAAPVPPPVPDNTPASTGDPVKATEEKINSMQQMFDQRRQMIQKQSGSAAPSPTASPN